MPRPLPPALAALADQQDGLLARRQLTAHGVGWDRVARHVAAQRWAVRSPRVVSTVTGDLSLAQRRWLAVLHAGPRSMLADLSAAAHQGLVGWERDETTVLVDDELSFEPLPGVVFVRSRRPWDLLASPRPGIACCRLEPALLLWAGYRAAPRPAHAVLAAAVQQRLTTPERLGAALDALRPLRRSRALDRTLAFVAGGAHSGAELEVGRMCRRHGLAPPDRQRARTDRTGRRRWTDAEWRLPDGSVVVLEVDGGHHAEVRQAADDARRSRRLVSRTLVVARCTAFELTHEAAEVAGDLLALGVPGRVPQPVAGRGVGHTTPATRR